MPSGLAAEGSNSFRWLADKAQVLQCKKVPILRAYVERLALKSAKKFTGPDMLESWA